MRHGRSGREGAETGRLNRWEAGIRRQDVTPASSSGAGSWRTMCLHRSMARWDGGQMSTLDLTAWPMIRGLSTTHDKVGTKYPSSFRVADGASTAAGFHSVHRSPLCCWLCPGSVRPVSPSSSQLKLAVRSHCARAGSSPLRRNHLGRSAACDVRYPIERRSGLQKAGCQRV